MQHREADVMMTPYMPQQEIAVIDLLLYLLKPRRVLEYGAGGSTVRWSPLVAPGQWVTVEHDAKWFALVARAARGAHVITGSATDARDYAVAPGIRGEYDLIIVDGLFRVECVQASPAFLASGGVVLLHDASREAYRPVWDVYPSLVHLTPGDGRANGLMAMWGAR